MNILGIVASQQAAVAPQYPTGKASVWYDAADTSSISVSGTAVTQWNDKGSKGLNLTQGTAGNRPTSGTTTLNGKNVITFDGGDVLTNASLASWKFLHDGTKYVVGIVVKVATVVDPENDLHIFTNIRRSNLDINGRNLQSETRGGIVDGLRIYVSNSNPSDYIVIQDQANVWDTDNPVVYTEICDPGNATAANRVASYFGNGTAIKTNTKTGTPAAGDPTYNMGFGATDQALQGITGYLAEVVIMESPYNTETDRTDLRNYLQTKWGL